MADPNLLVATFSIGILAIALSTGAALRAWQGWLDLRRAEIGGDRSPRAATGTRVEIARLRDRVRRLEAIANGSEL
jgi:hypothetical protein